MVQVPKGKVLLSSGYAQLWGWGGTGGSARLGSLSLPPFLLIA